MFIRDALQQVEEILRNQLEAEILLADCLGISREQIFTHPQSEISPENFKKFNKNCVYRARGKPLAYLTHHKEFFGLDFYVDERVLIPRPETELLVECSMLNVVCRGRDSVICDIGTGSGCIAIALAKNLPRAKITAVDISSGALEVARKNAKTHGVENRIEFIKSDLMEKISDRNFDIIVANLPYIAEEEKYSVGKEVLDYEPKNALFSGKTGLELFEKLFQQLKSYKLQATTPLSGGQASYKLQATSYKLICEIGFNQRPSIEKLIQRYFGNVDVEWKQDLAGIDRVFIFNL
ncbi:peptide chain release factor N(5)-glutamine methyltransferase [Candidatus Peregrinibacteria bacterium]|nr:peptide chain release factor N(5)-glutamine methyltransferase [Candidatus Peregrinibacteria bacterium]